MLFTTKNDGNNKLIEQIPIAKYWCQFIDGIVWPAKHLTKDHRGEVNAWGTHNWNTDTPWIAIWHFDDFRQNSNPQAWIAETAPQFSVVIEILTEKSLFFWQFHYSFPVNIQNDRICNARTLFCAFISTHKTRLDQTLLWVCP